MNRLGSMLLFLSILLAVTAAAHYYVWVRLVRDVAWPKPVHRSLTGLVWLLYFSIPVTFWLSRSLPPTRGQNLLMALYLWMGLVIGLPAMLGLADLFRSLFLAGRSLTGLPELDDGRRLFLQRAVASAVSVSAFGCSFVGVLEANGAIRVKNVNISLSKLPARFHDLVIAQLTDLHIGPTLRESFVAEVVERTNSIRPDIIVITGDLVDGSVEQLRSLVAPLAQLRAKHGVFFVPGNHEYYSDIEPWLTYLDSLGIQVLRNRRVTIRDGADAFYLVGIDDEHANRVDPTAKPDLALALDGADPTLETVLLAHQPKSVYRAQRADVGLQLSGHTHGGQVWPFHWLVLLQQPVIAGLARFGRTQLYVSHGTGYWGPPLRIAAPAEITRVVLQSGRREIVV